MAEKISTGYKGTDDDPKVEAYKDKKHKEALRDQEPLRKMDRSMVAKRFLGLYEEAYRWAEPKTKNYDKLWRYYKGDHQQYSRNRFSSVINECRRLVKDAIAIITQGNPRMKTIPEDPMDDASVAALDHQIDWLGNQLHLRKLRAEHVTNKLVFGSSWGYVRFDPKKNFGGFEGWPVLDVVLPHNVLLNPGASGPDDARTLFHIIWLTKREIEYRYPWALDTSPNIEAREQPPTEVSAVQGDAVQIRRVSYPDGTNTTVKGRKGAGGQKSVEMYPVVEVWCKEHSMFDFEEGYEQGGVVTIVGDQMGDVRPNMWEGKFPFTLDVMDRAPGSYHGMGLIEDVIDLNDFENRCRYLQQQLMQHATTTWVMDPINSGVDWDTLEKDGNRAMRRVQYNPGAAPDIMVGPGTTMAGSVQRMISALKTDINEQAGLGQIDFAGAKPQDIPSGIAMQTIQEIKQIRLRPIAEDFYDWLRGVGWLLTYSVVHHIVDGPRKFSAILTEEESQRLAPFIENMSNGQAVVDGFDASMYKDLRVDIRIDVVPTSIVDKRAAEETMSRMLQAIIALPPPFAPLIPHIIDLYDFPGKEKFKEKFDEIIAGMQQPQAPPGMELPPGMEGPPPSAGLPT